MRQHSPIFGALFAAEQQGGERHPLRRPAAPAPGPAALQEPGHSPHRVRQPQGGCQVTVAPLPGPVGEEEGTFLQGTIKKKWSCLPGVPRSRLSTVLTVLASQGSSPSTWKPSRPLDLTKRPSTSASCELFGAGDTRRTSHTPVSTSVGLHWSFPGSQVHHLCCLVTTLIKTSKQPCCPVLLCSEQEQKCQSCRVLSAHTAPPCHC